MPRIEDAMLLASEMVSYAVGLGGKSLALTVDADRAMGRVELAIQEGPTPSGDGAVVKPSGDRLTLIQALSEAWGVEGTDDGYCIWYEVRA